MVGKWGSETRKGKHLIKGDLSNKLLGGCLKLNFLGKPLKMVQNSVRIILSEGRGAGWGILYTSPRE